MKRELKWIRLVTTFYVKMTDILIEQTRTRPQETWRYNYVYCITIEKMRVVTFIAGYYNDIATIKM